MQITTAAHTDVGRVRTNNEDYFLSDEETGLFVVCDGMGGHNAGEVASKLCCQIIQQEMQKAAPLLAKYGTARKAGDLKQLRKALESAVASACKDIFKQAAKNPEQAGMGTTCTAVLLVSEDKGILAHVGDSRFYMQRAGKIHQLSDDHTYVNELVKRGAITHEQAQNHPQGNVLSRAMGVQSHVNIDTMVFDIDVDDTYLLCSDGIYNYFRDEEEIGTILSTADMTEAVHTLIRRACDRGGHDNCTAIVFRMGGLAPPRQAGVAADQRLAVLKQVPLFYHLTYNELIKVLGLTQLARAQAGAFIITEGQPGEEFYVILAGEVDVLRGDQVIRTLGVGSHLGEMALIDNAPRSASARARTEVNLLVMRREEFFGVIREEAVIASKLLWSLVKVLSGRLRETNDALQDAHQLSSDTLEVFLDEKA